MTTDMIGWLAGAGVLVFLAIVLIWNKRNVEAQIAREAIEKFERVNTLPDDTIFEMETLRMYDLDVTPSIVVQVPDDANEALLHNYLQAVLERFIGEEVARQTVEADGKLYLLNNRQNLCAATLKYLNQHTDVVVTDVTYTTSEPQ